MRMEAEREGKEIDRGEAEWLDTCLPIRVTRYHQEDACQAFSVIKSSSSPHARLVACHHEDYQLYLQQLHECSAAKQEVTSTPSRWLSLLGNWGAVSMFLADKAILFHWNVRLPETPSTHEHQQDHPKQVIEHGRGKIILFIVSCFLQLRPLPVPRVTLFQIPSSEARAFDKLFLSACYVPGSVLKAHTRDTHELRLQDSNSGWVHLRSLSFLQSFFQAQTKQATHLISEYCAQITQLTASPILGIFFFNERVNK